MTLLAAQGIRVEQQSIETQRSFCHPQPLVYPQLTRNQSLKTIWSVLDLVKLLKQIIFCQKPKLKVPICRIIQDSDKQNRNTHIFNNSMGKLH